MLQNKGKVGTAGPTKSGFLNCVNRSESRVIKNLVSQGCWIFRCAPTQIPDMLCFNSFFWCPRPKNWKENPRFLLPSNAAPRRLTLRAVATGPGSHDAPSVQSACLCGYFGVLPFTCQCHEASTWRLSHSASLTTLLCGRFETHDVPVT